MDSSELDTDKIIDWAVNYANYDDLEVVSKALYGIYAQWRKNDYPELHRKNKQLKRDIKNKKVV